MNTVLDLILDVFGSVGQWLATSVQEMVPMFYDSEANTLTFLGTLCIASLAISVGFLLIGIVQRFLKFGA